MKIPYEKKTKQGTPYLIAGDLPTEIAFKELRLNLEYQYSPFMAFMLIDMVLLGLTFEYVSRFINKCK